jgi:16S rRNA (guanine527-N7)-methyltransferase
MELFMDYCNYDLYRLKHGFSEFGIILTDDQIDKFLKYYELLIEWNSFMNLTAITDFNEVCIKHFVDSISIYKCFDFINNNSLKEIELIDVGSGAGFPAIPLKITFPDIKITMLDSLSKRVKFLNEVIDKLELFNIKAIHGRAEDFAKPGSLREHFDLCVSRAVANLSTLSEYCLPYVKQNGFFVAYKSDKISEELNSAESAINILGGVIDDQVDLILPDSDIYRNLIKIKKVKSTPNKYPRKSGIPSKEPL